LKGARHVTILHTRDRNVANSESFVSVLRTARGVWISGGGARLLETTYRDTLVARELRALLAPAGFRSFRVHRQFVTVLVPLGAAACIGP
jgi:cyanophycinase-like exopeptidase